MGIGINYHAPKEGYPDEIKEIAFYDMLGGERFRAMKYNNVLEIVPLAYMRGRTLEKAFIILDEAQNTLPAQMKMFLTRMGVKSKMIVNGDLTQIDLPRKSESGLLQAADVLKKVDGVAFIQFGQAEISALSTKIIRTGGCSAPPAC